MSIRGWIFDNEVDSLAVATQSMVDAGRNWMAVAQGSDIDIVDRTSGQRLCRLEGHGDSVWSVAVSSNGRQMASGSWDKTVRLWSRDDNGSWTEVDRIDWVARVNSVAFAQIKQPGGDGSNAGARLVVGDGAGLIRFWRVIGDDLQSKLVFDGMPPQKNFSKVWRSSWPHATVHGASADHLARSLLAQYREESAEATGVLLPGQKDMAGTTDKAASTQMQNLNESKESKELEETDAALPVQKAASTQAPHAGLLFTERSTELKENAASACCVMS